VNGSEETPAASRGPRQSKAFDEAERLGPFAVESVEEADELVESVRCDCGGDEMEEVAVRRTRTKRKPRKHFERHFFRCPQCSAEKVLILDVTARRRLLGV
jgi:hypothetical protein